MRPQESPHYSPSRRGLLLLGQVVSLAASAALLPHTLAAQESRDITGLILAASDSTPLTDVGVRVVEFPRWAQTDAQGRFTLFNLPRRSLTLVFERIGVRPDTLVAGAADSTVTVYLTLAPVPLPAVEAAAAAAARQRFEQRAQPSTVILDRTDITPIPTLGEADVARAVQLLPGTIAKNDFYVGFNVRGGDVDQNLIQLDGIPVFNPSHLGGLFSTFDPAAVAQVDYLTGAFPARFGGRLSSVLDVALRSGDRDATRVSGQLSLLSSKLVVAGPVGRSGVTYLVAARRTYADLVMEALRPLTGQGLPYYFADAVAKVGALLPTGGTAALTGYWGRDALDWNWIEPEDDRPGVDLQFSWGNRLAGLTVRHELGPVELEQHLGASAFATTLAVAPDIRRLDNTARVRTARLSVGVTATPTDFVRVGGGVEDYAMRYRSGSGALETTDFDLRYRPRVWSGFLDSQWQPTAWLQLRPGARVEQVTGGMQFTAVAPRLALKTFLLRDLALVASAGRFYQAIHSIRDQNVPLTLFDFWIGADDLTPVARADHLVLGIEAWPDPTVSVSVEGYGKSFDGLVIRSERDDPKIRGDEFVPADGWARGVDVLVRKYAGRLTGWVAYSFAKTIRRAAGRTFPPSHDRRHTLNAVLQAPGPWASTLGVRLGYGSGLPYTAIAGQWRHRHYNAELHGFDWYEDESIGSAVNGERFPYYGRLDVSLRWRFQKWGAEWRPFAQLVNALNRSNVWVYAFDYTQSPPVRSGLTQLPFFPTVGLEVEW